MPGKLGRAALEDFVRNGATTYFHPAGSCKMGPDAMAPCELAFGDKD